jgi:hypothetical protein
MNYELQQRALSEQRAFQTESREDQQAFEAKKAEQYQTWAGGQAAEARKAASEESDKEFRRNLMMAGIKDAGELSDEDLQQLMSLEKDLPPEFVQGLKGVIQSRAKLEKQKAAASKGSEGGGNEITGTTALNFVQDNLGPGYTPEVYNEAALVYQFGGQSAYQRWRLGAGDLPKVKPNLHDEAQALRDLEATYPEVMKEAVARGVPHSLLAKYVASGVDPAEAMINATSDVWTKRIVAMLAEKGVQVDATTPIDVKKVNEVIQRRFPNNTPIPMDEPQRELIDLINEMVRRNIGSGNKKGWLDAIQEILLELMVPPQAPRQYSHGIKKFTNVMADGGYKFIPGRYPEPPGSGMAGAVRAPGVIGRREP